MLLGLCCVVLFMSKDFLDFSAGSGSVDRFDVEYDFEVPRSDDGRGKYATGFRLFDVEDRSKWERLLRLHLGVGESSRKEDNREVNRCRDVEAFVSGLGVTDAQRERCVFLVRELELEEVNRRASFEVIALGVISLVLNSDDRWVQREECWVDLLDGLGVEKSEVRSIRGDLREYEGFEL